VQQHYVQQNSISLLLDLSPERHSSAASLPKWLMLVDLPEPLGKACPEDAQASTSEPFLNSRLPTCSSDAKGAILTRERPGGQQ